MLTKRLLKVALHATVVLAAATGVAQEPSRPAHLFMEVSLSPDARCVAAVEGDTSPAWTRDSRKFSFALRDPETHARSIYQVNADGGGLMRLIAFNGTIQALRYSAAEAGAAMVGDLDSAPLEQRIAVLEQNHLRWVSPANLFVYEYDWTPDGRGFVGTAAPGDGDKTGGWPGCALSTARACSLACCIGPTARNNNWRCRKSHGMASMSP